MVKNLAFTFFNPHPGESFHLFRNPVEISQTQKKMKLGRLVMVGGIGGSDVRDA